jgi:hypothetical protein
MAAPTLAYLQYRRVSSQIEGKKESRLNERPSELHNSDVEADVALSRCAPSGPRSLTPVVRRTRNADLMDGIAERKSKARPKAWWLSQLVSTFDPRGHRPRLAVLAGKMGHVGGCAPSA